MTGKYDRQLYIFTLPKGDLEFWRAGVRYDRQFYIFTLPMGGLWNSAELGVRYDRQV